MDKQEISNGWLALKTSLVTFFALILVLIIAVSFYMLAFTASAADFFNDTFSFHGLSAKLSYAAYIKDDEHEIDLISDAATRAIINFQKKRTASANNLVYIYTNELLSHDDFDGFAKWKDDIDIGLTGAKFDYFIKGNFHAASYRRAKSEGEKLTALGSIKTEMSLYGLPFYTINNPMSYVARVVAEDEKANANIATALLEWYETAFNTIIDEAQNRNLCVDAFMVASACGTLEQKALWQARGASE